MAVSERQEAGLVVEAVEDLVVALAQRLIAAVVLVDRVDHVTAGMQGPALIIRPTELCFITVPIYLTVIACGAGQT